MYKNVCKNTIEIAEMFIVYTHTNAHERNKYESIRSGRTVCDVN